MGTRKVASAALAEADFAARRAVLRAQAAERMSRLLHGLAVGEPVKTCGACTPARGTLLAVEGEFAWVAFDGADQPRTWPLKNLEAFL